MLRIFPWFPIVYKVPSPQPGTQHPPSQLSVPVGTKPHPHPHCLEKQAGWEKCMGLKHETQQVSEQSVGG